MKKPAVFVVIIMLLAASGCVSVRLDYAMDAAGGLNAEWRVEARRPAEGDDALLKQGMNFAHEEMSVLASQWESRGIATETVDEADLQGATGRRTFSGDNEGAFDELGRWMKEDGFTPFSAVTANRLMLDNVQEYYLDATLDWADLVEPASLAGASPDLRAGASAVEKNCAVSVSLSLPGRVLEHEGEVEETGGISTCTVKASPGNPARIMLHTRVEKKFTAEAASDVPDALMRWGIVGICGLAGLLMLVIALRCVIKMARYRGY
jgi:hypothetical protein